MNDNLITTKDITRESNMQDKIKALRRSGVMDAAYNSYTFENDDGRNPKITASCKRYADHWQETSGARF